jgi:hypothetical protein
VIVAVVSASQSGPFPPPGSGSAPWHADDGVFGAALAGGDLLSGGSDEVLRLSPGTPRTISTQWSLEGVAMVRGDGRADIAIATASGLGILAMAP